MSRAYYHDCGVLWKRLLETGLEDDDWQMDWTTLGCCERELLKPITARIIGKSEGVWAADGLVDALGEVSSALGMSLNFSAKVKNGDKYVRGTELLRWVGPARMILAAERPFLNLASYAGGIATETRALVDKVEEAWKKLSVTTDVQMPRITATRKTLPGYRDLAVHAVIVGGGHSHRVSLSGGVLIKENHIASAGGIEKAISGASATAPHGLKIEVEVRNLDELVIAIDAGADVVMLDNFGVETVKAALELIAKKGSKVIVEVSGGIRLETIQDYVLPGVNVISIGALTHSVKAVDLSLLVD